MEVLFREMKDADTQQVLFLFNQLHREAAEVSFAEILEEAELCKDRKEKGCHPSTP